MIVSSNLLLYVEHHKLKEEDFYKQQTKIQQIKVFHMNKVQIKVLVNHQIVDHLVFKEQSLIQVSDIIFCSSYLYFLII